MTTETPRHSVALAALAAGLPQDDVLRLEREAVRVDDGLTLAEHGTRDGNVPVAMLTEELRQIDRGARLIIHELHLNPEHVWVRRTMPRIVGLSERLRERRTRR